MLFKILKLYLIEKLNIYIKKYLIINKKIIIILNGKFF